MSSSYLEKLNREQRLAVEHGVGTTEADDSALLILAGAGTGKTNTLAHRVVHLILNNADPRRILLMTFSRRAAAEMTRRVQRIANTVPGATGSASIAALTWAGTFHAIGARLLREYASQIGLDPNFTIHDREDSADLLNLIRHDLGQSEKQSRFPTKGTCLAIYSRVVNSEQELEAVLAKSFPWCCAWEGELRALFAAYVEAKQRHHVLDYDDLLLYWAQMMAEPSIAADVSERFDHVLVDEYQDTNRRQASVLLALKPTGKGLTVVGDDAQSISSFRAATVRNILDFPAQFNPPAAIVTLERNYRSTQPILAASNAVMGLAAEGFTKNLWSQRTSSERPLLVTVSDEAEQARYVVERVLENREVGSALKDQAVLFRASHHSAALEVELTLRGIPFVKFGGAEVPGQRTRERRSGVPALGREPPRPRRGFPRPAVVARCGPSAGWLGLGARRRFRSCQRPGQSASPERRRHGMAGIREPHASAGAEAERPACRDRGGAAMV
jgi:DNA helicase-2/ATP-dependent DNA helicase PcrA